MRPLDWAIAFACILAFAGVCAECREARDAAVALARPL